MRTAMSKMLCAFAASAVLMFSPAIGRAQPADTVPLRIAPAVVFADEERADVVINLSRAVPWRIFTQPEPNRIIVDFQLLDGGFESDLSAALSSEALVGPWRSAELQDGWLRLVADLQAPLRLMSSAMHVDQQSGGAQISLHLAQVSQTEFNAHSAAPFDPKLGDLMTADPAAGLAEPAPQDLVVAIDAGHGGFDPGAQRAGLREADIVLDISKDLARAMGLVDGMVPILTREEDVFLSLEERMSRARAAGADVFISLHADALAVGNASGASVYRLGFEGAQSAAQRMVERHERTDILQGLDLSAQDDALAKVLMDLARAQTGPQSERLQAAVIAGLGRAGGKLHARPAREATLGVLMAADFPSVLVEVGFLSNPEERAALLTPQGRAPIVAGLILGLRAWHMGETERAQAGQ